MKTLSYTLLLTFYCLVLFEAGSQFLVRQTNWSGGVPTYTASNIQSRFWSDINSHFGVWHPSNDSYHHKKACFDVTYLTNSYGMRDDEQAMDGPSARTVVLGDSFVEGFGVAKEDRVTDRLAKALNRPYLNFGTAGNFGPTQYQLLYQHLAGQFNHDAVLVGLLPENDFTDDDMSHGQLNRADRYRPYYVSDGAGGLALTYYQPSLEKAQAMQAEKRSLWKNTLREFTAGYHVWKWVEKRHLKHLFQKPKQHWQRPPSPPGMVFSRFYDYTPADWRRLTTALKAIKTTAGHRPVTVALWPRHLDFARYAQTGFSRLGQELAAWGQLEGIRVIDLLPPMTKALKEGETQEVYFHPCDGHWNAYGNKVAADILGEALGGGKK